MSAIPRLRGSPRRTEPDFCSRRGLHLRDRLAEMHVPIKVKRLRTGAQIPRYAHAGEFGDLAADLYAAEGVTLEPTGAVGSTRPVATGIALEFPSTHGALVEDR